MVPAAGRHNKVRHTRHNTCTTPLTTYTWLTAVTSLFLRHIRTAHTYPGTAYGAHISYDIRLLLRINRTWKYNIRVFLEKFGWVGFLAVYFLYQINPKPLQNYVLWGKKWPPDATFNLLLRSNNSFSWFGLALGWGVRRFHIKSNISVFFNPTQLGIWQTPYFVMCCGGPVVAF